MKFPKGMSPEGRSAIAQQFFIDTFGGKTEGEVERILNTNLGATDLKTLTVMLQVLQNPNASFEHGIVDLNDLQVKVLNNEELKLIGKLVEMTKKAFDSISNKELATAIVKAASSGNGAASSSSSSSSSASNSAQITHLNRAERRKLVTDATDLKKKMNTFLGTGELFPVFIGQHLSSRLFKAAAFEELELKHLKEGPQAKSLDTKQEQRLDLTNRLKELEAGLRKKINDLEPDLYAPVTAKQIETLKANLRFLEIVANGDLTPRQLSDYRVSFIMHMPTGQFNAKARNIESEGKAKKPIIIPEDIKNVDPNFGLELVIIGLGCIDLQGGEVNAASVLQDKNDVHALSLRDGISPHTGKVLADLKKGYGDIEENIEMIHDRITKNTSPGDNVTTATVGDANNVRMLKENALFLDALIYGPLKDCHTQKIPWGPDNVEFTVIDILGEYYGRMKTSSLIDGDFDYGQTSLEALANAGITLNFSLDQVMENFALDALSIAARNRPTTPQQPAQQPPLNTQIRGRSVTLGAPLTPSGNSGFTAGSFRRPRISSEIQTTKQSSSSGAHNDDNDDE